MGAGEREGENSGEEKLESLGAESTERGGGVVDDGREEERLEERGERAGDEGPEELISVGL